MDHRAYSPRKMRAAAALATLAALLAPVAVSPAVAQADTAPIAPETVSTVSADVLPTAQINGVVWDQVVVGNTVYVTGSFTSARPAGSAAGTNEVARSHAMAYNIATGVMTSWAPSLNAQGLTIDASADGSTIFIGGDFTTVNGVARQRLVAVSASTGAVVTGFVANANARVKALEVAGSTLYFGGTFSSVNSTARTRLAAVSTSAGALTSWAPKADQGIQALTVPGNGTVVVGGNLELLNGETARGMGAVDATTGANRPWAINQVVQNYGPNAAILSLTSDGSQVYGSAYDYYGPSEFEGSFAADSNGGALVWLNTCKGDTYDVAAIGPVLYSVGHPHNCSPIGGHPQTEPWTYQRALATTTTRDGVNSGGDFSGQPKPRLLAWTPYLNAGTYTGKSQSAWSVTGNASYVVLGGEFPKVNGTAQQGLVRFAITPLAPNKSGPQGAPELKPSTLNLGVGTVRVAWTAAYDRDNRNLTYTVLRGSTVSTATTVATISQDSYWWNRPRMSYVDPTAPAGSTVNYWIRVKDAFGNTVTSAATSTSVSATDLLSTYAHGVIDKGANSYWPLGESSGTTGYDWLSGDDLSLAATATRSPSGPIGGTGATIFAGTQGGVPGASTTLITGPQTFSIEAWVNTTSTSGGKIVGFGNSRTGDSSNYDRHVYMSNDGKITFGVHPGGVRAISSAGGYNDGKWHHIVATLGSSGMALYVDGVRAARDTTTTSAQDYAGYWRIGGDNFGGWPNSGSSNALAGQIGQVAIYPVALSASAVGDQYTLSGRTPATGQRPGDAYGRAVYDDGPDLYWRLDETSGSTAKDITVAGNNGAISGGATIGQAGQSGKAVAVDGSSGIIAASQSATNPSVYSEELWFSTTTTTGGKLIGFGNQPSGASSNYDRHVYMLDSGQLRFGVWTGETNTIDSPASYNDGQWHHLVATQGSEGMRLYVDGALVGQNSQTGQQGYTGYWRVGGDTTWGGASSDYFKGLVDEVAVYSTQLSAAQVGAHYAAAGGTAPNQVPTAAFTASTSGLRVDVDGSGSVDSDGSVASYVWDFGDGSAAVTTTAPTASYTYASAGTRTVSLTVVDNRGASSAPATRSVTTTAVATLIVQDLFGRTVSRGLGTANIGGAWTVVGTSTRFSVDGSAAVLNHTAAGQQDEAWLTGAASDSVDLRVQVAATAAASGNGMYVMVTGRRLDGANHYDARLRWVSGNKWVLTLMAARGSTTATALAPEVTVPGTFAPGSKVNVRLQVTGTGTTALRVKAWADGTPEPSAWTIERTDSFAALQTSGYVGFLTYLSGSSTTLPIAARFSNLEVGRP